MAVRILRTQGAQASQPVAIRPAGGAAKPRARGIRRAAAAADKGDAVLLEALAAQELIPTHEFKITVPRAPRPRAGARRSAAAPRAASVDLGVDVAPNESAVVLVEQDGEYSWHYPDLTARPARSRPPWCRCDRAHAGHHSDHAHANACGARSAQRSSRHQYRRRPERRGESDCPEVRRPHRRVRRHEVPRAQRPQGAHRHGR